MTFAATSPRPQRPNPKPAPNSERVMVGCDVLLSVFLVKTGNLVGIGNGVFNAVEITGDRAAIPAVMTWNRNPNDIVGGGIMAVSLGA
ncbi:MAG: hypothetical protein RLZZ245_3903, partial [Verrucomicrobiota bacterium]